MGKLKCQIAGSECCKTCKHDADEPMGDVCKECMSGLCTLIYEYVKNTRDFSNGMN